MVKNKFLIFDLDGTLIDTIVGIKEATNNTLKELGAPYNYDIDEVKSFVGNGAPTLFKLALKRDYSNEEYNLFMKNYEKYQYSSVLFPYVEETLNILIERGYLLFLHSNKPDQMVQKLFSINFPSLKKKFIEIRGNDSKFERKPSSEYIDYLVNKYNLDRSSGYYIGDSIVDVKTSNNSNLKSIIFSYGYGNKDELRIDIITHLTNTGLKIDYILDSFDELLTILL